MMPVLFLEENYEDENNLGELGTPNVLRRQEYWSLTGGALAGHMYGSYLDGQVCQWLAIST